MHYSSSTAELSGLQHVTDELDKKRVFLFAPIVPILHLAKNCANAGIKFAKLGPLNYVAKVQHVEAH